jgi:hypothetical protein
MIRRKQIISYSWCLRDIELPYGASLGGQAMVAGFQCAGCGEWNETTVDEYAGHKQSYVEDCQVCCKPNLLHISYDPELGEFVISSQLE